VLSMPDHHLVTLAIRWLHVAAMALVLGGALLVCALCRRGAAPGDGGRALLAAARAYEWLFWLGAGTLVMTGVGNLGAFGAALPAPQTRWGGTLTAKLLAVLATLLLAVVRTRVVARASSAEAALTQRGWTALRVLYGLTGLALGGVSALAVWLAHG
jgi:uncharacterized membrane protein